MRYFVYLLASKPHGALYLGSTSDLRRRIEQHRSGAVAGHAAKYKTHLLVWFEAHASRYEAVSRERAIKGWRRAWKDALIEAINPQWRDLGSEIPLET